MVSNKKCTILAIKIIFLVILSAIALTTTNDAYKSQKEMKKYSPKTNLSISTEFFNKYNDDINFDIYVPNPLPENFIINVDSIIYRTGELQYYIMHSRTWQGNVIIHLYESSTKNSKHVDTIKSHIKGFEQFYDLCKVYYPNRNYSKGKCDQMIPSMDNWVVEEIQINGIPATYTATDPGIEHVLFKKGTTYIDIENGVTRVNRKKFLIDIAESMSILEQ
jgi:hypothetical protein